MTLTPLSNPFPTSNINASSSNTIPSPNPTSTVPMTGSTGSSNPSSQAPGSSNPNLGTSAPSSSQGASSSKAQQLLAAYMLLSPDSKARVTKAFDALNPADPDTSTSSTTLFSTSKEIKMSTTLDSTYGLGIHPTINDLAKAGQYLPLILFTDDMTKRLHRGGLTLKKIKSTIGGVTHHLLDLAPFPAEDSLDAFTWQEAWKRYLTWLQDPKVAQPEIHERWLTHYSLLSKDEAIRSNFKAILTFDMNWRASYAAQPFIHDPVEWQLRLQATKSEIATERLLQLSSRDDRPISTHRYDPYDSSRKNARRPRDSHDQSFRDNTSDIKPKSEPTCLICGRNGHRIAECKEEITTKGKQTFAKFFDGQLVRRSNDAPLCILFNLNLTRKPCKHAHAASQHLCSFCGESTHAALARLCI
ncbi:hypothetical protein JVT61DRAFT_6209 [Boletus reticuloceps]|uniref:CCHC-type domain-containing protein n=1 Tax=Boletus reticuloceps TaxID=495285 RepID=A0A8I3A829_9AGAM|nr:hypothetical protein JVT61DRAFT_6209 [Boletus reticuloceps]